MVNGEKFKSHAVTLTLMGQCPLSNSSKLFLYTTIFSSFKWIEPLFFELLCTLTGTHRHTDRHEYSIVAVDKLQQYNLCLCLKWEQTWQIIPSLHILNLRYRAPESKNSNLIIHFTNSPKGDHIYKLHLYMLREHNCLISILTCSQAEI